jgi:4-amino-4-deoxy-L-arabinose transferase-like glycosyltransferase
MNYSNRQKKNIFVALSVLILATGIFVRFWQLNTIPPGIQYDEAFNGLNALEAIKTGDYKIFYTENYGREGFHINVTAFFIKAFGPSNFSLRVANAIWGSLTLIGFYFLLRQLKFSRLSVLLGTFMVSFSFWHLVFSRTAYRAIMVPMLIVWVFYFILKALEEKGNFRILYVAASGLLLGLGINTYIAFRVVPLTVALFILSLVFTGRIRLRKNWKIISIFIAASLVVSLPIIIYFSGHTKDFLDRSEAVSIFFTTKMSLGAAFWKSLTTHINAFFVSGDHNPRHNYNNQPLLPAAWSVLFALGFFISLSEIASTFLNLMKRKIKKLDIEKGQLVTKWFYVSVLAQSIFWTMLAPGILSIEGIPHSLRIIGMIPAVFILAILPFEYIMSLYAQMKKTVGTAESFWELNKFSVLTFGLVVMVIYAGYIQTHTYFRVWAKDLATYGAYERKLYNLGLLIKSLPTHNNNYLITSYNTWVSSDNKISSLKTTQYSGYPNLNKYLYYRPMDGYNYVSCDDSILVFQESDQWLRDQYKNKCPNLTQQRFAYDNGKYMFWVMTSK